MGEYTTQELISIFAMQGFAGISLFSVLLLMALGLAIIFGQMGVTLFPGICSVLFYFRNYFIFYNCGGTGVPGGVRTHQASL
jgi:branched-subunit amino acid ABC-type transport system permease component